MWCQAAWIPVEEAEDIDRRMSLASQAYGQMYSLWLQRKHVSEKARLKPYNSLVVPVLLYNCETWRPSKAVLQKLPDRSCSWSFVVIGYQLMYAITFCKQTSDNTWSIISWKCWIHSECETFIDNDLIHAHTEHEHCKLLLWPFTVFILS